MTSTLYTDPSGLDPTTVSTAADQATLLGAAMRVPEFATVAGSEYVEPSGVRHPNTNRLLGQEGVFAGKTGSTTEAGRTLLLAAHRDIAGASRLVLVALMKQPEGLADVILSAARTLLTGTDRSLIQAPVLRKGEAVAHLADGWGNTLPLVAAEDVTAIGRPGATVTVTVEPGPPIAPGFAAGSPAAHALVGDSPADRGTLLVTAASFPPPSMVARLTRKF
jgi:D-alanyl-D-alanine carboxypeptidase